MAPDELRFWLQRPIAFHRAFATVAHGATGGLFLSQLFYWSDKGSDPDGWIYKTQEDWLEETALTRSEQERARKVLKDLKLLEEDRRGVPARLYYRLDIAALASMLDRAVKDAGNKQASVQDAANLSAESSTLLYTETTPETTQRDDVNPIPRLLSAVRRAGPGR